MQKKFSKKEIADMTGVSERTVQRWVADGMLKLRQDPVSKRVWVTRRTLIAFLKKHEMPLGDLESAEELKS